MVKRSIFQSFALLVAGLVLLSTAPLRAGEATVFAAASLKTSLDEIAATYQESKGDQITLSYGGSSVLARQIELGAPADLFVSANAAWMDHLEEVGRLDATSRTDLLGNRLALVMHGETASQRAITPELPLAGMLGEGRLAMALVEAVPAGIYGKAALEQLGLWPSVASKVAQTDNVRAALALVATGAAPIGVVYATDAQAEPRVTVVGLFPEDSHPTIIYPAALTLTGNSAASSFLDHLQSPAALNTFRRNGFIVKGGNG